MMLRKPVLLIALVVFAVLCSLLIPVLSDPPGWQNSYSYAPSGHRAFFETASALRPEVRRWRRLPAALSGEGQALLLLEPDLGFLADGEASMKELVSWVQQGNDLILVPRASEVSVQEMLHRRFEVSSHRYMEEWGLSFITSAFGADYGFSLNWEDDDEIQQQTLVAVSTASASTTVSEYSVHAAPVYSAEDLGSAYQTVFQIDEEPAVLEAAVGEGRLVVVLAPNWFLNKNLAKQENANAIFSILAPYGPNGLLVDEFFHGLPQVNGLLGLLFRPPFLWLTLSGLLLMLLLAWAAAFRTEPEKVPPLPSRRNKREHLDAMGQLLASTKNHSFLVQRLVTGLEQDLRLSLRLSSSYPVADAINFLRRRDAELAEEFEALREQAVHVKQAPRESDAWLLWGRRVHTMRQKLNHE